MTTDAAVFLKIQHLQLLEKALEDLCTVFCRFTKVVLVFLRQQTFAVTVRMFKVP